MIATDRADYTGALYYLQLSLNLAQESGDYIRQGHIYTNLGRTQYLTENLEQADKSLEEGVQILTKIGNRPDTALALFYLAKVQQKQNNQPKAAQLFEQSLSIAKKDKLKNIECQILLGLAEFLAVNDTKKAKQTSTEARKLAELLQNPRLLKKSTLVEQHLQTSIRPI